VLTYALSMQTREITYRDLIGLVRVEAIKERSRELNLSYARVFVLLILGGVDF
jgi:hypothetical protein